MLKAFFTLIAIVAFTAASQKRAAGFKQLRQPKQPQQPQGIIRSTLKATAPQFHFPGQAHSASTENIADKETPQEPSDNGANKFAEEVNCEFKNYFGSKTHKVDDCLLNHPKSTIYSSDSETPLGTVSPPEQLAPIGSPSTRKSPTISTHRCIPGATCSELPVIPSYEEFRGLDDANIIGD
jgi:hypothetical protein